MPQLDLERYQDEQSILRDVLHTIASTPESQASLDYVVKVAQSLVNAVGGCYLIFNDPRIISIADLSEEQIPADEMLKALVSTLTNPIEINPPLPEGLAASHTGWLVGQVQIKQHVVGLLWLEFNSLPELSEFQRSALAIVLDGLTVITRSARSNARHEKLSRNQYEFMRIVSHDLRSPLTSMQGFASMLESGMVGELNEKQMHYVDKILSGITQMASLVDNIQDAGRYDPETGFYEMERSQVDLTDIVRRIVSSYLLPAEKQELTIVTAISDDVPIINADVNMLERAIINLVDNAIKYTPNGRQIEVNVRRDSDDVVVRVKDNGLGISPEHQKMLFERHVRIPRQEHKRVKGSGLGLFIVRSVAHRHGGKAWVESILGEGSTFCISIPLNEHNSIVPDVDA